MHGDVGDRIAMLHRHPDRHAFFASVRDLPPRYDTATGTWVVAAPDDCRAVLTAPEVVSPPYDYSLLGERFGADFSDLDFAVAHIPNCHNGDRHQELRRSMGEFIASRRADLDALIPGAVARRFAPVARPGRVELMAEVVEPLVLDVVGTLVELDLHAGPEVDAVPLVFDQNVGLAKRRRSAAQMKGLREAVRARLGPDADETDVGMRLALVALGNDTLAGTIGASLAGILASGTGRRVSEIDFPDMPTETGVPYVERLVGRPVTINGAHFGVGERVRVYLQSLSVADDPASRARYFGAGLHACLGRPLSLKVWRAIGAFLSAVPTRVEVLTTAPSEGHLFYRPVSLELEISE